MLILIKKTISASEKRWGFIQLPVKLTATLPKEFDVSFNDLVFHCKITKNRIVSKKIYTSLGILEGDVIVLEQNEKNYAIKLIRD